MTRRSSVLGLLLAACAVQTDWVPCEDSSDCLLGGILSARGTSAWADDVTFWRRAAEPASAPGIVLVNLASVEHDNGDLVGAWRTLARATGDKDTPEASYTRSLMLAELGCAPEAEAELLLAVHARPTFAEAWTNLAGLLRSHGRFSDARLVVTDAARLGINSEPLRRVAARLAGDPGDDAAAGLPACDGPIDARLSDPDALVGAALDRGREGELDLGENLVRAALRLRPDHPPALLAEAQLRYLRGDFRAAAETAEHARDAGQTMAWKVLGLSLVKLGETTRGREYLARYLAAHPQAPDAEDLRRVLTLP